MGWFASGFLLGRLLFTPFMLRLLALAALFGLAAQARYGVHERFMYWLTYRQIHHDYSALMRFVDLNEPWMSWSAGVLYAVLALVMLVLFVRLVLLIPVVLEIALSGMWRGAHFLVDALLAGAATSAIVPLRAVDRFVNPRVRVKAYRPGSRRGEILDPLPLGSVVPRHASEPYDERLAS